jgi:selenocysteine-specific elongation factor
MSHFIIGTAGHIDHGKTSLVKALTGMDTDVLKEEKERNITIDIGFASCTGTNDFPTENRI